MKILVLVFAGFSVLVSGLGLAAEGPPEQPRDYYVDMAVLNLFTYDTVYNLEPDPSKKFGVAQEMAFISFNYFVQKEKAIIRWSAKYEKAILVSYNGMRPKLGKDNPYLNPCGWSEGKDEPKLQFPKTHRLTHEQYMAMVRKFVDFLEKNTD
jgi:hypothetical protein